MQQTHPGDRGSRVDDGSLDDLRELIRGMGTVMLVTATPEGQLRGRPMAVQDPSEEPGSDLWFVTSEEAATVEEIAREQEVALCCLRGDQVYLSISARAFIERDRSEIQRLWRPDWQAWIPGGPDDPHAALLKLTVEHAELWEPGSARPRAIYSRPPASPEAAPGVRTRAA
ncbi:MAG: pyridoxamine 5'-phosphate oxidase family protein [Polyangiaceae bacterium]|nr:pyridoxamine 5'-phosphate oxidase family protein [Polyangiaceae bacterium]